MHLNQITLPSTNVENTKQFYLTLGCELIVDTAHYLRFKAPNNDTSFSFSLTEADNNAINHCATIYFECENLTDTVEELLSKGIEFDEMPTDKSYLWCEAKLTDPSGNAIILYFAGENRLNPPWRV